MTGADVEGEAGTLGGSPPATVGTAWRILSVPDYQTMSGRHPVDVTLAVDTTEPLIVDAVERGAATFGLELERVA